MKLSNLSVAIVMALGVVACGGNGSGDQTIAENETPTPNPETPVTPESGNSHDVTLVDPTQTHVVDDKDLLTQTTVGALQYIRREGSNYDRVYNPDQRASSTPLLGVPLDDQNPKLTNIVLARQDLTREDGQPVKAQYVGGFSAEPLTREGRPHSHPSLQAENFQNVDILAGAFKLHGRADQDSRGVKIENDTKGDKQDYDTHVQDNIDKSGEFTRERVSHVYTLRFEYLQPYVDYPNVKEGIDPGNPAYYGNPANHKHQIADSDLKPAVPALPTQAQLIDNLNWATTGNNYKASHAFNTGLGIADVMNGIENHKNRYIQGGRTHAPIDGKDYAYGPGWTANTRWGAHSTDVRRNWQNRAVQNYPDDYPKGAYPWWSGNHNARVNGELQYNGWKYEDDMAEIKPRQLGDPRYPNEPYNEDHNGTLSGNKPSSSEIPYTHEHTYLEADEFTAIRRQKLVRPLVNPIANTWEWTLEQEWQYTLYTPNSQKPSGFDEEVKTIKGTGSVYLNGTAPLCGSQLGQCTGNWTLLDQQWINPVNKKDGRQGEFRGPAYQG